MDDSHVQCTGCFKHYDREQWYRWPIWPKHADLCGPCCDDDNVDDGGGDDDAKSTNADEASCTVPLDSTDPAGARHASVCIRIVLK